MSKNTLLVVLIGLVVPAISSQAQDKIDFYKQIYPFVKSGCVKCHQPPYAKRPDRPDRLSKPKADIIMTSPEELLKAVDEDGNKIIVPGKPDESRMLQVTHLPLDDDYHFPPEGKAPQWTDAEKELFAEWIKQGADFGEWKGDEDLPFNQEWDMEEKKPGTVETWDK